MIRVTVTNEVKARSVRVDRLIRPDPDGMGFVNADIHSPLVLGPGESRRFKVGADVRLDVALAESP